MATVVTNSAPSDPAVERRRVWWAQALCAAGQGLGAVLLSWIVLHTAHGPAAVGLVIAAGALPLAFGTTAAARAAEHAPRRRLLVGTQAVLALVAATMFLLPDVALWGLVVAALLTGAARLYFDATALSVLHHLVDTPRLGHGLRDLTTHYYAGHLTGVALGVVGTPLLGPHAMFAVCAGIFGAGALVSRTHHADINLRPANRPHMREALESGWSQLWAHRTLRGLTLATLVAGVCAGGAGALLLPYLTRDLALGPATTAVLLTGIAAVGAVMVSAPRLIPRLPWRATVIWALAAQPVALLLLGAARGSRQASLGYACLLASGAVLGIVVNQRRAHGVPGELRAPIGLAGGALVARAVAAGALIVGAASVPLGDQRTYVLLGALGVAAGLVAVVAVRPQLRPLRSA